MFCIPAELDYVPLRNAHVLEHLPWCVRYSFDLSVNKIGREISSEIVEGNMRATAAQQVEQVITKLSIAGHGS